MPSELRGRRVAHVRIAYAGDPADGARLVEPLPALGRRLKDTVRDMPYTVSGFRLNPNVPPA